MASLSDPPVSTPWALRQPGLPLHIGSGIQTQVLTLKQQVLLSTEPSLQPDLWFFYPLIRFLFGCPPIARTIEIISQISANVLCTQRVAGQHPSGIPRFQCLRPCRKSWLLIVGVWCQKAHVLFNWILFKKQKPCFFEICSQHPSSPLLPLLLQNSVA